MMNTEQYRILLDVHRSLGVIEGKQDLIIDNQKTAMSERNSMFNRVGRVENKLNWYSGVIVAGGSLIIFFKEKVVTLFL